MCYIYSVFSNELAFATNGILSDEGITEKWLPTKNKWKSYQHYYNKIYSKFSFEQEKKYIPTELLGF